MRVLLGEDNTAAALVVETAPTEGGPARTVDPRASRAPLQ